jgi:hypothetical protein
MPGGERPARFGGSKEMKEVRSFTGSAGLPRAFGIGLFRALGVGLLAGIAVAFGGDVLSGLLVTLATAVVAWPVLAMVRGGARSRALRRWG